MRAVFVFVFAAAGFACIFIVNTNIVAEPCHEEQCEHARSEDAKDPQAARHRRVYVIIALLRFDGKHQTPHRDREWAEQHDARHRDEQDDVRDLKETSTARLVSFVVGRPSVPPNIGSLALAKTRENDISLALVEGELISTSPALSRSGALRDDSCMGDAIGAGSS